ncbi:MAG TPA: dihydrolipoamide acetyltransferase family protein [Sphingomonas sp.]|nr:dihydrolipoamide acetyltransferase family protein [Sphingomonas sp.]
MSILRDLNIPRSGSVENAKLLAWHVAEGEPYAEGDLLYEIETDKVATEVEATEPGILAKKLAAEGDEHKVGDRIGYWVAPGTSREAIVRALDAQTEAEATANASKPEAAVTASPQPAAATGEGGERLSPLVRRLAKEHGVDLATVRGSGPAGRITGDDVLAAAGKGAVSGGTAVPPGYEGVPCTKHPHSLRRKTIARRLVEAAAAPTLTADMEIDLSGLLSRREAAKAEGPAPSVLALIAVETARLLSTTHKRLNATYTDEAALMWDTVNLGIAIDTEDGLVVPVIRDAQGLDAPEISRRVADLAERARSNSLRADELEGGTFTLSNPGSLGPVIRAEAILNTPQVALLGLPGMVRIPRAIPDGAAWSIEVRPVLCPSLTFDHRALDGGAVISFLNDLKAAIEAM